MSIREEYEVAYTKYTKLLDEHNKALIQAISVSDDVSKEIFQEAYLDVQSKLQIAEVYYKSLEPEMLKEIANELFTEHLQFYSTQFVECSLEQAFYNNGLDLSDLVKQYRMRPITSLQQKRELCLLLNEMKIQAVLIDYEGKIIDTIGKYTFLDSLMGHSVENMMGGVGKSPKKIIIRCKGIASVPESIQYVPILAREGLM